MKGLGTANQHDFPIPIWTELTMFIMRRLGTPGTSKLKMLFHWRFHPVLKIRADDRRPRRCRCRRILPVTHDNIAVRADDFLARQICLLAYHAVGHLETFPTFEHDRLVDPDRFALLRPLDGRTFDRGEVLKRVGLLERTETALYISF